MKPGGVFAFVFVCARGGWFICVYGGGLAACVCESECCFFYRWARHIWNFGIWAADQEFSSWGVRRGGDRGRRMAVQGAVWGSEWAVPLSSLPSFPPLHTFTVQLSVSTLTLSGWGVRIEEKTCHHCTETSKRGIHRKQKKINHWIQEHSRKKERKHGLWV